MHRVEGCGGQTPPWPLEGSEERTELERFDAGAGLGHITASNASVSRMLSHSTSKKCSATCFQLGVSSLL